VLLALAKSSWYIGKYLQAEASQCFFFGFFLQYFFGALHSATFIFIIFVYVIASIAYIHPVYGAGVQTHDLSIMSRLPWPLDQWFPTTVLRNTSVRVLVPSVPQKNHLTVL
jgi:hypothetical protein